MQKQLNPIVFAVAAHPDDIEFMMAGTLGLLHQAGCQIHVMNLARGDCGTETLSPADIAKIRTGEARASAAILGATFHEPLVDDLMIFYEPGLLRKLAAVVREVHPTILLLQSPQDYMEDHVNTSRLMVTAAFARGMKNYITDPPQPPLSHSMAVYHALPYGLTDQLRRVVKAELYVDIGPTLGLKRDMLACHRSQKDWLDASQALGSYLKTMEDMAAEVGQQSGAFRYSEGWVRHSHLGFGAPDDDPLSAMLKKSMCLERKER